MEYNKEYYENNKERINQRSREYYRANREKRLEYQNAYNKETEAERKQKNRERYWAVRDKNMKAKPVPTDYPIDYAPVSFSPSFS
jgi:hypothetical protein